MSSKHSTNHLMISSMMVILWVVAPKEPQWDIPIIALMAVNLVFMIRSFIKGDAELEAQRKRELRVQQIRELEEAEREHRGDEGFEPLDLEWPEELLEEIKKREDKQ